VNCQTCTTLHPTRDPAYADMGQLCASDYGLITSWLRSIPSLFAQLLAGQSIPVDHRTTMRLRGGDLGVANLVEEPADPIAGRIPAGPTRSTVNDQPRVSGSRERSLGVAVAPLNLMSPASTINALRRAPEATDTLIPLILRWSTVETVQLPDHEDPIQVTVWRRAPALDDKGRPILIPAGDHTGPQPTARWLDRTVLHWLLSGAPGRHLPDPEVPTLVTWLLDRIDWACDNHPDLGTFAYQLRGARAALNRVLGLAEQRPKLCPGVPCSYCKNVTLIRKSDYVECDHCGKLYSDDAYAELLDAQRKNRARKTP
jgi:ribosomal protein L37AE/L43A